MHYAGNTILMCCLGNTIFMRYRGNTITHLSGNTPLIKTRVVFTLKKLFCSIVLEHSLTN